MKLRRIRKSKQGRIEIIPMIDVMFFLLVTFMLASLTAHYHFEQLPINLANGKAAALEEKPQITLMIDEKNNLFLNQKPIALDQLKTELVVLLQGSEKTVIIASDKNSLQGKVVEAMLKAREAGAHKFSIMVKN